MSRAERVVAAFALALLASSAAVAAEKGGSEKLRPSDPVKINADHAEWQKGGSMVYTGNVRLESGDLKLTGDRLNLKQFDDGEFEAKVDGKPAKLDHAGLAAAGSRGDERPPVTARASTLTYDSRTDVVEVAGDALLTRGTDEIKGQNIRYDVTERRIEAQGKEGCAGAAPGKEGCQVEIVIQPPPRKGKTGEGASGAPPAPGKPASAP